MQDIKTLKVTGVTGRVTTKDGVPINGAVICRSVAKQGKNEPKEGVLSGKDGRYTMIINDPGPVNLVCIFPGTKGGFFQAIQVERDKLTSVNFELEEEKVKLADPIKPSAFEIENFKLEEGKSIKVGSLTGDESLPIRLTPGKGQATTNDVFYKQIKTIHNNDFFRNYRSAMDDILQGSNTLNILSNGAGTSKSVLKLNKSDKNHLPFNRTEAYSLLKFATEKYVEAALGLDIDALRAGGYVDNGRIPYYDLIIDRIKEFVTVRRDDIEESEQGENFLELKDQPILVELIWSYWHEEGMLVQTMNAIAKRFQNIRNGDRDPLANLELDPLRPLNNIIWGYIQDAQHRLTIARRSYEYDHNYGLRLFGKAVEDFVPADSRSKFINAFHNLLYRASLYFKEADDMTINADAFPLLNALREVHLILSESSHNQYGDLPTVSRIEMLVEQYILSRPEIREFLGGRVMVPYKEEWMDRVDTMKTLQGWGDVSVTYYHDLATYGEQILLSIRLDNWSKIEDRDVARNWADLWRDAIQRYLHSYYSVTGVDLTVESYNQAKEEKFSMPAFLIQQKVQKEKMLKEKTFKRV